MLWKDLARVPLRSLVSVFQFGFDIWLIFEKRDML